MKAPAIGFREDRSGNETADRVEDSEDSEQARNLVRPYEGGGEGTCSGGEAIPEGINDNCWEK